MTGFTACGGTVPPLLSHTVFELTFVRIGMATGAIEVFPVVDGRRLGLEFGRFLVAIGARHRNMPARQHEPGLFVLGQGKGGGLIPFEGMAAIAGVEVGRRHKLPSVLVRVAVGAARELDLENSVRALGDMALAALHPGVPTLQRIGAGGVFFHREGGRLPALHGMAGGALNSGGTLGKLAFMGIRRVTVRALAEAQRLLEIAVGVALLAPHGGVLAFQRIFGLRVIEVLSHGLQRDLLPSARRMAG